MCEFLIWTTKNQWDENHHLIVESIIQNSKPESGKTMNLHVIRYFIHVDSTINWLIMIYMIDYKWTQSAMLAFFGKRFQVWNRSCNHRSQSGYIQPLNSKIQFDDLLDCCNFDSLSLFAYWRKISLDIWRVNRPSIVSELHSNLFLGHQTIPIIMIMHRWHGMEIQNHQMEKRKKYTVSHTTILGFT